MPKLTFPGDKVVDIEFGEKAHSYVIAHKLADGTFSDYRPTHGITTPLSGEHGVVPKPFLKPWAAKLGVYAALDWAYKNPHMQDTVNEMFVDLEQELDKEKPWQFRKKYSKWLTPLKTTYKTASDHGKEQGTWLHSAIELYYKSDRKELPILTEDVVPMWSSFIEFDNYYKPKPDPDGLEFFVYSMMFGYSGQGDFKGEINGKWCIGDWKTTTRGSHSPDGISYDYFIQLGGLAQAEWERTGKWPDDVFIANFDKKGGEPKVLFASDLGMSPQDCAKAYIVCFNAYHVIKEVDYKFHKKG